MKNKKGFMSISIIYSFLILFLLLMFSILISYSNRLNMVSSLVIETKEKLKENRPTPPLKTVSEKILSDNVPISDVSQNFASPIGSGLFYTADNQYGENGQPIYYFGGNVNNNWVSFGGFLWRIVRTTSEGGIKLAYSGNGNTDTSAFIGVSIFETETTEIDRLFYTRGYTNSAIKTVIDNWYVSNLASYSNYLSTTAIYCNDQQYSYVNPYMNYFFGFERIFTNKRPTFSCPNNGKYTVSGTTGNGYLTYSIALLSADEVYFSLLPNSYINQNALQNWWTMTPVSAYEYPQELYTQLTMFSVYNSLDQEFITYTRAVRPAVSLKSCIVVTGGTGTKTTPYLLSDSNC